MTILESIVVYGLSSFGIACLICVAVAVLVFKHSATLMPDEYASHADHLTDREIVASAAWHRERLEALEESLVDWFDEEYGVCDTDAVYEVIWCGHDHEALKERMQYYDEEN